MCPFKIDQIKALTELPDERQTEWLGNAQASIAFLQANARNDEIVIYASTRCALIHGVLALAQKLTLSAVSELQHRNIPMPDDSWRIQRAWGGGKGHRMYLEAPLNGVHESLKGGEKLIFRRTFTGVSRGPATVTHDIQPDKVIVLSAPFFLTCL
jgi:hypothetical protein